jgi:hypothetical protein
MMSGRTRRTIVDHLEETLGRIVSGWTSDADGRTLPVQVALFPSGPVEGTRALATLGLSKHKLMMGKTGRTVRQELVMAFRDEDGPRNLPAVMQQLAMSALDDHRAYLRGDVIGPRGPIFSGSIYEALYVTVPVYFPDTFHQFEPEADDPIVLAWVVPITHGEAHLIQRRGWSFFEDQLEAQDPDLLAAERAGVDVPFRD